MSDSADKTEPPAGSGDAPLFDRKAADPEADAPKARRKRAKRAPAVEGDAAPVYSAAPDSKNPPPGFVRVRMKTSIAGVNFSYKPKDEPFVEPREAANWERAGFCEIIEEEAA